MCCSFLWSGSLNNSSKAKVAWTDVCKPKAEGGLGIRALRDTSMTFSFSLIWRLLTTSNSLWVDWTKHYLLRNSTFWDAPTTRGSWIWQKLLKLRPLIKPFIRYNIRDGCSTHFWQDTWIPPLPLICRLGDVAPRVMGIRRDAMVSDIVAANEWRLRRSRNPAIQEVINYIQTLPVPDPQNGRDFLTWRVSDDDFKDTFSSTATWNQIRHHGPIKPWHKVVWFSYSIPRYSFITWLAILDRLSTGARMLAWGANQPCPLCDEPVETRDHLFFRCSYSLTIWRYFGPPLLGLSFSPNWNTLLKTLYTARRKPEDNVLLRMAFQCSIYHIWRERNDRIHGKPPVPATTHAAYIKKTINSRLLSCIRSRPGVQSIIDRWHIILPP